MNRRSLLLLFCIVTALFIAGCAEERFSAQNAQESASIAPEDGSTTPTFYKAEATENMDKKVFSRKNIDLYLGVWMPVLWVPGQQSLEEREDLVALGANTVEFAVQIPYYADGSIDEEAMEGIKNDARRLIRYYKEVGLAVALSPEPLLLEYEGEPRPLPAGIRERFVQEYTIYAIDLAQIAEEENAEIFSPMNEPDYKLGYKLASSWGQEILPEVRKVFMGKVMWKGLTSDDVENINNVDFSGYDIIGFTSFPWGGIEDYKSDFRMFLTALQEKAARDGVKEIVAAEFGTYEPVRLSKHDETRSIQYVFEEGKGKLHGFFVFDPPGEFGTPIKGSELEGIVKEEFEKFGR